MMVGENGRSHQLIGKCLINALTGHVLFVVSSAVCTLREFLEVK